MGSLALTDAKERGDLKVKPPSRNMQLQIAAAMEEKRGAIPPFPKLLWTRYVCLIG